MTEKQQQSEKSRKCYRYGSLVIDPEHGCITTPQAEIRLGPVNMGVLVQLLENQGKVVSRAIIFDSVWKNQVVSDDVLTRCISDLRKTLKSLNEATQFIETLPKRGYRWLVETEVLAANSIETCQTRMIVSNEVELDTNSNLRPSTRSLEGNKPLVTGLESEELDKSPMKLWGMRIVILLFGLLFISTGSLWIIDNFALSKGNKVALIPIQTTSREQQALAVEIEEQLASQFVAIQDIQFLSRSATQERPANPFPYLVREFGTQWIIEGRIRAYSGGFRVSLDLVDARTATVSMSFSRDISQNTSNIAEVCSDFAEQIRDFLGE